MRIRGKFAFFNSAFFSSAFVSSLKVTPGHLLETAANGIGTIVRPFTIHEYKGRGGV